MAGYLLDNGLMFAYETFKEIKGLGFGLWSPASKRKIKSQKGCNAGEMILWI